MPRRIRQKDRGRWEVERERHHIAGNERILKLEDAEPIAESVARIVKKAGLERESLIYQIEAEWVALAGDAVARHARPGRLETGTLTVFVDSSVWLSELSRYGAVRLMDNISRRFGKNRVKTVRFNLDPDGGAVA